MGPVTEGADELEAELMGRLEIATLEDKVGFVDGARVAVVVEIVVPAVEGVAGRTAEVEEVGRELVMVTVVEEVGRELVMVTVGAVVLAIEGVAGRTAKEVEGVEGEEVGLLEDDDSEVVAELFRFRVSVCKRSS